MTHCYPTVGGVAAGGGTGAYSTAGRGMMLVVGGTHDMTLVSPCSVPAAVASPRGWARSFNNTGDVFMVLQEVFDQFYNRIILDRCKEVFDQFYNRIILDRCMQ